MIGRWVKQRLKLGSPREIRYEVSELHPDAPFYAIGDIHGSTPLVRNLLAQIREAKSAQTPVVFLGDYIDRGEDSSGTLKFLYRLSQANDNCFIFLRGNHEQMLLDFLDYPETTGPFWLMAGGKQTIASFSLQPPSAVAGKNEFIAVRDMLRAKLGSGIEAWLRQMPLSWQTGNVFLSHAGADPTVELSLQTSDTLLWGAPLANAGPRSDKIWCVQGHIIVSQPKITAGRVFVDTGAYATGTLTAVKFETGQVDFLST